jgi:hypothetical protein
MLQNDVMEKLYHAQWKHCKRGSGSIAKPEAKGSTPKGAGPLFCPESDGTQRVQ